MAPRDWEYKPSFLTGPEASNLYDEMMSAPWQDEAPEPDASAIHYGISYRMFGGPSKREIPVIPEFLIKLSDKVSRITDWPVNYVQCHKYGPATSVRPHEDPRGMCVPMIVVGQERTFRVGGTLDTPRSVPQSEREVSWHQPDEERLLQHGSLLVFNGGRTNSIWR